MKGLRIKRPSLSALLLLVILVLALAGGAYAAINAYSTPKFALFPGGLSSGGVYTLQQVIGEPVTGYSTGGTYTLCAGYLCGSAVYRIYLPLGMK